jgi:hypothetical protein
MALKDAYGNVLVQNTLSRGVYEMDYYSGSNLFLMMGDVLIDTAASLRWTVQQSKTPVYGYAQQYYSFVASGHVLVQGTLGVAFKESGYMLNPIQRFANFAAKAYGSRINPEEATRKGYWNNPRYRQDKDGNIINSYVPKDFTFTEAARAAENKKVAKGNVEQMQEWHRQGENPKQFGKFNKLYRELAALPDNAFEDQAEVFEDVVWYGSDISNPLVRDNLFNRNLEKNVEIDNEAVLAHRRIDQYPPIDLTIVYGDAARNPTNHTVRKILDVSFTGQSQPIEIDGTPVYDTYEFIARTVA